MPQIIVLPHHEICPEGAVVEASSGESVCDVLNAPVDFVPITRRGGALRLVALDQVMTVGLPPDLPEAPGALETEADAEVHGTVVKVSVLLSDGTVIEGGVAYAMPAGSSRLQDHLNQAGRFIELHTSEGRVLVNKRFISHVGVLS